MQTTTISTDESTDKNTEGGAMILGVGVSLFLFSILANAAVPVSNLEECRVGQECYLDLPGLKCADGTQSYFTYTRRSNAQNLMVYLEGGGACWSESTCKKGFAKPLTRVEPNNNWSTGQGIASESEAGNPFRTEYNIVTVPYCTGDAHTGNRTASYSSSYKIRHVGYGNVLRVLNYLRDNLDKPKKAVLVGCSAGGIGATFHLRNFAESFPDSQTYVLSDAGLPFKPPHVKEAEYKSVMASWGADKNLPDVTEPMEHFGHLVRYNTQHYPDVRFGFISSYRDLVMTFFAMQVGSPNHMSAVKTNIIDVADNEIGKGSPLQKVFYTESRRHCHTFEDLASIQSMDSSLGDWITGMVEDSYSFQNVRPDLDHPVNSAEDANDPLVTEISEIQKHLRH